MSNAGDAIRTLYVDYAMSMDLGHGDVFARCFEPDALMIIDQKVQIGGRDALSEFASKFVDSRPYHVMGEVGVHPHEGRVFRSRAYAILANREDGQIDAVAMYDDLCVVDEERALFRRKEIELVVKVPRYVERFEGFIAWSKND